MSLRSEVIRIFNELIGASKKISELDSATTPLGGTELLEIVQGGVNKKVAASNFGGGAGVQSVVGGTNVTIDNTDPQNPIINASGGGGSGTVESVTGDGVDNTDPANPVLTYPTPGDIGAQADLGFTPENVANKAIDFTTLNDTLYPSVQATENRIIAALAGLKWKAPVRVATTVAGTLATSFENGDAIDGVALATGNRILIKNQATQSENGIYTVNASGAPTRATDADSAAELEGATVTAQEGTSNADTTWVQTTDGITLGSSNIVFTQFGASVPDATSFTKGIARLYNSTSLGTNTDGAPDQNAVKVYVDTELADLDFILVHTLRNTFNF